MYKKLLKDTVKNVLTPLARKSEDKIRKQIDKYTTVSFDVFDTLLERDSNLVKRPEDVFKLVGDRVGIEGFKDLRIAAENMARDRTNKEDVQFSEIYEYLDLDEAHKKICKTTELEIETEICKAKKIGKSLYNYAVSHSRRVIIISNMYFSEEFIDALLKKNGYNIYEKLFVSCEYGKRKGTGNLFREARKYLKETTWLHIGDNIAADGFGAQISGVKFAIL